MSVWSVYLIKINTGVGWARSAVNLRRPLNSTLWHPRTNIPREHPVTGARNPAFSEPSGACDKAMNVSSCRTDLLRATWRDLDCDDQTTDAVHAEWAGTHTHLPSR